MKKQKHISMRLRKKMPLPTKRMMNKNKESSKKACRQKWMADEIACLSVLKGLTN